MTVPITIQASCSQVRTEAQYLVRTDEQRDIWEKWATIIPDATQDIVIIPSVNGTRKDVAILKHILDDIPARLNALNTLTPFYGWRILETMEVSV